MLSFATLNFKLSFCLGLDAWWEWKCRRNFSAIPPSFYMRGKNSFWLPPSNNSIVFCGIVNVLIKPSKLSLKRTSAVVPLAEFYQMQGGAAASSERVIANSRSFPGFDSMDWIIFQITNSSVPCVAQVAADNSSLQRVTKPACLWHCCCICWYKIHKMLLWRRKNKKL